MFRNASGAEISGATFASTGSTVEIISDNDGSTLEKYTFILFGDLDGDGSINARDFLLIKRHIWSISALEGPALVAASVYAPDKATAVAPTARDFLLIKRHIWNLALIEQPV